MKPTPIDETHAPALKSWVESANIPGADFPIQNLPLGAFRRSGAEASRLGVAIGDAVLDLGGCLDQGLLRGMPSGILSASGEGTLNALMARPDIERRALRHRLSHLLRAEGAQVTARPQAGDLLFPQRDIRMVLPARIGDYTDFYASIDHATNVGAMMRPDDDIYHVNTDITDLKPGATYHCRLVAVSSGGTTRGADRTFTTPATKQPLAETGSASRITATSARLDGRLNALGEAT